MEDKISLPYSKMPIITGFTVDFMEVEENFKIFFENAHVLTGTVPVIHRNRPSRFCKVNANNQIAINLFIVFQIIEVFWNVINA